MTSHRRLPIVSALAVAAAACAVAGCGSSSPHSATAHAFVETAAPMVTLKNIAFHPKTVHVSVGQSVTWKWEDADIDTQHNVTSIGAARFKSSATKMAGTYTVRFNHAGTYRFECTIHPQSMQGEVIVRKAS